MKRSPPLPLLHNGKRTKNVLKFILGRRKIKLRLVGIEHHVVVEVDQLEVVLLADALIVAVHHSKVVEGDVGGREAVDVAGKVKKPAGVSSRVHHPRDDGDAGEDLLNGGANRLVAEGVISIGRYGVRLNSAAQNGHVDVLVVDHLHVGGQRVSDAVQRVDAVIDSRLCAPRKDVILWWIDKEGELER